MSKKNELNDEQLKKVSGGETYDSLEKLSFLYGKEYHVQVHTWRLPFHQFTESGRVTKRGYTFVNNKYSPCYYIECSDDKDYSGWYDEDYLQDTTYWRWKKIDSSIKVTVVD